MTLLGLLAGLAAATTWGTADFAGGLASRQLPTLVVVARSQVLAVLIGATCLLISRETLPGAESLGWSVVAGAIGCVAVVSFFRAMAIGEMSLVAPLVAVVGSGIPLALGAIAGERLLPVQLSGAACGLIAVVMISRSVRATAPASSPGTARALPLAVVAGCAVAGVYLTVARASEAGHGVVWWPVFVTHVVTITLTLGILAVRRPRATPGWTQSWRAVAAAGVGDAVGFVFFIVATAHGELSLEVVLSSLYPITTALLAVLILGERPTRQQRLAMGLAVVGVVLIAV